MKNETDWNLDRHDIEYYTQEFNDCMEKENGFGSSLFHMSNEKFSDNLFAYFKNVFSDMEQWKTPQGQFFTFGAKGKAELVDFLYKSINEKKKLIAEMEKVLEKLPEPLPLSEYDF